MANVPHEIMLKIRYDWEGMTRDNYIQSVIVVRIGDKLVVADGAHRVMACRKLERLIPTIVLELVIEMDPRNLETWIDKLTPEEQAAEMGWIEEVGPDAKV